MFILLSHIKLLKTLENYALQREGTAVKCKLQIYYFLNSRCKNMFVLINFVD